MEDYTKDISIQIPYFDDLSYNEIVSIIKKSSLSFENFNLIEDINDLFKFSDKTVEKHLDLVIKMMSDYTLYKRKEYLTKLIESTPPREVYEGILRYGSSEVIAGLFLELAKKNDPIIKNTAHNFINSKLNWTDPKFAAGIRRCAILYNNSISPEIRKSRVRIIRQEISDVEFKVNYPSLKGWASRQHERPSLPD